MTEESPKYFYWAAYAAAACWVAQMFIGTVDMDSMQRTAAVQPIMDGWLENVVLQGLWILMAVALLFFGSACRTAFLAHPGIKSGYATALHSGWLLAAVGLCASAWTNQSMLAAAENADQSGVQVLAYLQVYGWFVTLIGLSTAFIAVGLGDRRTGLLPAWFTYATAVLGFLGLLGALHIPPGGLLCYLLLAPWLVAAGLLLSRVSRLDGRRHGAAEAVRD